MKLDFGLDQHLAKLLKRAAAERSPHEQTVGAKAPANLDERAGKIVDAVKAELKLPNLKINLQPVTSSNRIPLMQNGTIDLECGSDNEQRRPPEASRFQPHDLRD